MTSLFQFQTSYELWAAALVSSASIGLTSLVPWVFNMKFDNDNGIDQNSTSHAGNNSKGPQNRRLKLMLSFAVGSILGDIFLHLIPESINSELESATNDQAYKKVGLSIICGVLVFIIVEKLIENWLTEIMDDTSPTRAKDASDISNSTSYDLITNMITTKDKPPTTDSNNNNNNNTNNNNICNNNNNNNNYHSSNNNYKEEIHKNCLTYKPNGIVERKQSATSTTITPTTTTNASRSKITAAPRKVQRKTSVKVVVKEKPHVIETAGYLNLIANGFDNFTHGLAVGASFLVGFKVGLLTTFVIIIHEIPHEICDYAILLNSGFNRWDAVKAQSSTAIFGVLGTVTALSAKSVRALSSQTGWILPFSSGGFLYIALVNILPELLDDRTSSRDSFDQIVCVLLGISFMAVVAAL